MVDISLESIITKSFVEWSNFFIYENIKFLSFKNSRCTRILFTWSATSLSIFFHCCLTSCGSKAPFGEREIQKWLKIFFVLMHPEIVENLPGGGLKNFSNWSLFLLSPIQNFKECHFFKFFNFFGRSFCKDSPLCSTQLFLWYLQTFRLCHRAI